jgi:hypothetical protein
MVKNARVPYRAHGGSHYRYPVSSFPSTTLHHQTQPRARTKKIQKVMDRDAARVETTMMVDASAVSPLS